MWLKTSLKRRRKHTEEWWAGTDPGGLRAPVQGPPGHQGAPRWALNQFHPMTMAILSTYEAPLASAAGQSSISAALRTTRDILPPSSSVLGGQRWGTFTPGAPISDAHPPAGGRRWRLPGLPWHSRHDPRSGQGRPQKITPPALWVWVCVASTLRAARLWGRAEPCAFPKPTGTRRSELGQHPGPREGLKRLLIPKPGSAECLAGGEVCIRGVTSIHKHIGCAPQELGSHPTYLSQNNTSPGWLRVAHLETYQHRYHQVGNIMGPTHKKPLGCWQGDCFFGKMPLRNAGGAETAQGHHLRKPDCGFSQWDFGNYVPGFYSVWWVTSGWGAGHQPGVFSHVTMPPISCRQNYIHQLWSTDGGPTSWGGAGDARPVSWKTWVSQMTTRLKWGRSSRKAFLFPPLRKMSNPKGSIP